jgi:hypothetical protein
MPKVSKKLTPFIIQLLAYTKYSEKDVLLVHRSLVFVCVSSSKTSRPISRIPMKVETGSHFEVDDLREQFAI